MSAGQISKAFQGFARNAIDNVRTANRVIDGGLKLTKQPAPEQAGSHLPGIYRDGHKFLALGLRGR